MSLNCYESFSAQRVAGAEQDLQPMAAPPVLDSSLDFSLVTFCITIVFAFYNQGSSSLVKLRVYQ